MEELRPVEALYLMFCVNEEEWSDEDSLTAVLIYLVANEFIKPVKKNLVLTEKGEKALSSNTLREYEVDILQAIKEEDPEYMVDAIDSYSFKKHFINIGLFTKVPAKFLFIRYRRTVVSEIGNKTIDKLLKLREKIKTLLAEKNKFEEKEIILAYAFPSISGTSKFKKYAKEIVGEAEDAATLRLATRVPLLQLLVQ